MPAAAARTAHATASPLLHSGVRLLRAALAPTCEPPRQAQLALHRAGLPRKTPDPPPARRRTTQVKRARGKQLSPDEYTTGTFTISNLGMFGVESFDAILPPGEPRLVAHQAALLCRFAGRCSSRVASIQPAAAVAACRLPLLLSTRRSLPPALACSPAGQAAILAVGGSKPVVTVDENGRIGVEKQVGGRRPSACLWVQGRRGREKQLPAGLYIVGACTCPAANACPHRLATQRPPVLPSSLQMNLNITCDHRIVYGAHAAEFLLTLKSVIENPDQLVF